jgi:hypothetical protein
MKKHLIAIGMTLMLLIVGFSGCITEDKDIDGDGYNDDVDAFPNDISEWLDSDNDSVGDNSDDFPHDDKYYEKAEWSNYAYTEDLHMELGGNRGRDSSDYLSSDWTYVIINWTVIEPTDLTKEQEEYIFLEITNPEYPSRIEYPYSSTGDRHQKIYINASNWGEWRIGFQNKNALYTEDITVTIEFDLYKVR